MNRLPELRGEMVAAAWPAQRVAEAIHALATYAGFAVNTSEAIAVPGQLTVDQLNRWIETSADQIGIQADQAFVALDEIDVLLTTGAPVLIRLSVFDEAPLLAVTGRQGRFVRVLGTDLRIHQLSVAAVAAAIRRPFETDVEPDIAAIVKRLNLGNRAAQRAHRAMLADRLKSARFRGCWLLGRSPAAPIAESARQIHIVGRITALLAAYVAQYALFVLSWWLLGRGILQDTIDRGWLLGWVLLLASLIPVRLATTWNQGAAVVATGAWVRRRLLRGASLVDRQQLRSKGVGRLFGLVIEASALDALALSGGVTALFSIVELGIAAIILTMGAAGLAAPLLVASVVVVSLVAWRYYTKRTAWTASRIVMSDQLLERMIGHRTRIIQQAPAEWHRDEDQSLDDYLAIGEAMDRVSIWLSLAPRGWLLVALAALVPSMAYGATSATIAISIGGALLAYRALQRLVAGFSNLAGAVISARAIKPLAAAASKREPAGVPAALVPVDERGASKDALVAQAREITFRYRRDGDAVLDKCSLNVGRSSRFLLEGPSGSGKTTLASIIAGLEQPDAGLLLLDGLDRGALGAAGWRNRVVMAPQANDNYLVTGSLAFNLLMGHRWPAEPADLQEAERMCRELGLGDLLDRLPAGVHQVIGETGWRLSQGERTRVFLARALLQHPELLVLDESFSALDADNAERAMRCTTHNVGAILAVSHF